MGNKLKGKDFLLYMSKGGNQVPVCCGRDLSISIQSETIEVTRAPESVWRSYVPGVRGYSVTATGLVVLGDHVTVLDMYNAIDTGTPLQFIAMHATETGIFFSGSVVITGLETTGNNKDIMTYSVSGTGSGRLNMSANPYEIEILTDEEGNPITDEEGNLIYSQETGGQLPIDLNINC